MLWKVYFKPELPPSRTQNAILVLILQEAQEISAGSPFPYTLFSGYSNGGFSYLPVRSAYPAGGYEVETSPFAPGAAEIVVEQSLRMLNELWSEG